MKQASAKATSTLAIMLSLLSLSIKPIQGMKRSVVDSLSRELAKGNHQSRTSTGKGVNPK